MYNYKDHLGSIFIPSTKEEYRQWKLQTIDSSQSYQTRQFNRYYKYKEQSHLLKQFLEENRLEKVLNILANKSKSIPFQELYVSILALYETDLFLETGRVLTSNLFLEIMNAYRINKANKFSKKDKVLIHLRWNYHNILSDLFRSFFDSKDFPERIRIYYYQKLYNLLLDHFPEQQLYFDMRGPSLLKKLFLGYRIRQELTELSYSLFRKEYTSNLLRPSDLKLLGSIFFQKFINNANTYNSSRFFSLNLVRSLDNMFTQQIKENFINKYSIFISSCDIHNVYRRHKKFFREIIDAFFIEKTKKYYKTKMSKNISLISKIKLALKESNFSIKSENSYPILLGSVSSFLTFIFTSFLRKISIRSTNFEMRRRKLYERGEENTTKNIKGKNSSSK